MIFFRRAVLASKVSRGIYSENLTTKEPGHEENFALGGYCFVNAQIKLLGKRRNASLQAIKPSAALQFPSVAGTMVCRPVLRDTRRFCLRSCAAPRGRCCGSERSPG